MRALFTLFLFIPIISFTQYWQQLGLDIDGEAAGDGSGYSVSMNAAGDRVAIGAHENDGNGSNAGHVRIYAWNGASWTQQGQDIDGEAAGDNSGQSVSLNAAGNRVAIGAFYNNNGNGIDAGHVRIYEWDGTNWIQLGQDIDGEAADDRSGCAVSINSAGDRVAIGAYMNNNGNGSNAGHVRIYSWDGSSWIQLGQDIDGEAAHDFSGLSVTMNPSGDRVAIGARNNDGNGTDAGHVRVYAWDGNSWMQQGQDIDGEASGDWFGSSVSINSSGNLLAIGALKNDGNGSNSGHVRIYFWDGINWIQQGQDIDGEAADDRSGRSVSMNPAGDRVAIGAYNNDGNGSNAGHVRIYSWDGSSWIQLGQDIDGEAAYDYSGSSVTMNPSGDRVAIGAYNNDGNGSYAGHVRIYSCNTVLIDSVTVCDSATWINGNTYYSSTYSPTFIFGPNPNGCDSITRLNLIVNYSNSVNDTIVACNSYTWIDGNTYTASTNTPTYTLTNTYGCDSVVTLNLTFNNSSTGTDTQTACDSYTWIDGITYTQGTNTPTYTLTNSVGCDSVVTLNLTINTVDNGITNTSPTLSANASGATYQWLDCNNNNAVIPGETNQSFTATTNGSYAVEVTQNGCADTSACEQVNNVGINEFNSNLTLHPNPTNNQITIDIKGYSGEVNVEVYDLSGRLLESTNSTTVSLRKYERGIYIFKVSYGEITEEVRVVRD